MAFIRRYMAEKMIGMECGIEIIVLKMAEDSFRWIWIRKLHLPIKRLLPYLVFILLKKC